jgi:hypothetical protein
MKDMVLRFVCKDGGRCVTTRALRWGVEQDLLLMWAPQYWNLNKEKLSMALRFYGRCSQKGCFVGVVEFRGHLRWRPEEVSEVCVTSR